MKKNSEKIKIMLKNLSDERRKMINNSISNAVIMLGEKNAKPDTLYTLEITEKFDQEEPVQFIWLKIYVVFRKNIFETPQGAEKELFAQVFVIDMEVYDIEGFDNWLDHIERIKKNENLYLSKGNEVKTDKFSESYKDAERITEQIQREVEDEARINEQMIAFMDLFMYPNPHKKTTEEYMETFFNHTKIFANRIMDVNANANENNIISGLLHIQDSLKMLTSEFSECDFTMFKKDQLENLGFVNWKNKIMMIPVWAFPIILKNNKGLILRDIHGSSFVLGKDFIDTDNRNGIMPVGFPFKINDGEIIFDFSYGKTE